MDDLLPLIMDGLIVLLLAGTIFFAARLSLHLKTFRDSRHELESLIKDLAQQTGKAEAAIEGMRQSAKDAGRDLQSLINESKSLSDELEIMTEAGNNMANRLERLAEATGRSQSVTPPPAMTRAPSPSQDKPAPAKPGGGFSIRDKEFEDGGDEVDYADDQGLFTGDYEADEGPARNFESEAEKELYEALRGRKASDAGGF